jgi:hypothetical protein
MLVPPGTNTPSEASPCADCEQRWFEELNFSSSTEEVVKHYELIMLQGKRTKRPCHDHGVHMKYLHSLHEVKSPVERQPSQGACMKDQTDEKERQLYGFK